MTRDDNQIGAGEFKTHCLKLIDRVNQTKHPITITKHGKPMAKLTPIEDKTYSLFGCLENTVEIHEDIVEGTGEIWEVDVLSNTDREILLDTHTWIWLFSGSTELSEDVIVKINQVGSNGKVFISAISVWELSMLVAKNRVSL